jgi:3'-phosphoadenosine 5'-phosphosulfate sulfotransferase (PAPS reductase)/FAD synthetase
MDWSCTVAYCKAVGEALGIPVYLSFRDGGFEREMLRDNQDTAPCYFQTPTGWKKAGGNSGKLGTRLKFPQISADLSVRWCSSSLKIDVCGIAFRNDPRFEGIKTLFISGERAEESIARSRYPQNEIHRSDPRKNPPKYNRYFQWLILRLQDEAHQLEIALLGYANVLKRWFSKKQRHIDHWRPVLLWKEAQVWEIIERFRVNPHPAYRLGWSRVSCLTCIFGSPRMWASALAIVPKQVEKIDNYEILFNSTIKQPKKNGEKQTVLEIANNIVPFNMKREDIEAALSDEWQEPIILNEGEWVLPAGAFGEENAGPT